MEEVIDELMSELRSRHVYRMTHKLCNTLNGIEYQNMLHDMERISDACSDIAVYLLGRFDDSINGREHQYIHELHHSNDAAYLADFNSGYRKYFDRLNAISVIPDDTNKSE